MKTQEEIERLANDWSDDYEIGANRDIAKRSYIAGYTQCQQDMADKKYTEEDMRAAMICVIVSNSIKNSKDITEYIASINKQD
jgi:hypothetical protein